MENKDIPMGKERMLEDREEVEVYNDRDSKSK